MPDVVQIHAVKARSFLRLKSWQPECASAARPFVPEAPAKPARVLCIGPCEWLIVSHEREHTRLRERIVRDLSEHGLSCIDANDELVAIEVHGSPARELLAKGCGLDFHPTKFSAGQCVRTRFAQIPIVIDCLDPTPRFELYVARSYSHYLYSWLTDAACEFAEQPT